MYKFYFLLGENVHLTEVNKVLTDNVDGYVRPQMPQVAVLLSYCKTTAGMLKLQLYCDENI